MAQRFFHATKTDTDFDDALQDDMVTTVRTPVCLLKDQITDTKKKSSPRYGQQPLLQVTIDATHSGRLVKGISFYLPTEMAKGASSFVKPYQKPVLRGHDDQSDPIGRIVKAKYRKTEDYFKNRYPDFTDILNTRTKPSDKIAQAANVVLHVLAKDKQYQQTGLGYIELTQEITDTDAIEKFLDGRYLTGSTYFRPLQGMYCSICKKDVMSPAIDDEEPCPHWIGDIEDGIPFFVVPFGFSYLENSAVNIPADADAIVSNMKLVVPSNSEGKDSETIELLPCMGNATICSGFITKSGTKELYTTFQDTLIQVPTGGDNHMDITKLDQAAEEAKALEKNTEPTPEVKDNETPQKDSDVPQDDKNQPEPKDQEGTSSEPTDELVPVAKQFDSSLSSFLESFSTDSDEAKESRKTIFNLKDAEKDQMYAGMGDTFPCTTSEQIQLSADILKDFADSEIKTLIQDTLDRASIALNPKSVSTVLIELRDSLVANATQFVDTYKTMSDDEIVDFAPLKPLADTLGGIFNLTSENMVISSLKHSLELAYQMNDSLVSQIKIPAKEEKEALIEKTKTLIEKTGTMADKEPVKDPTLGSADHLTDNDEEGDNDSNPNEAKIQAYEKDLTEVRTRMAELKDRGDNSSPELIAAITEGNSLRLFIEQLKSTK